MLFDAAADSTVRLPIDPGPGSIAGDDIRDPRHRGARERAGRGRRRLRRTKITARPASSTSPRRAPARAGVDVDVDGSVTLEEVAGDLRVGLIRSRTSDVVADGGRQHPRRRPGDDATQPDRPARRRGREHHARSRCTGSIGTEADFLETNLLDTVGRGSTPVSGILNATAAARHPPVRDRRRPARRARRARRRSTPAKITDVSLVDGRRLDPRRRGGCRGRRRRATASTCAPLGGGIGLVGNDLDVNTCVIGLGIRPPLRRGRRRASSSPRPQYELRVLAAKSRTRRRAADHPRHQRRARPPEHRPATRDEDLILLVDRRRAWSAQSQPRAPRTGARRHRHARPAAASGPSSTSRSGSATTSSHPPAPTSSPAARSTSTATRTAADRGSDRRVNPDPLGTPSATNADTHAPAPRHAGFGTTMTLRRPPGRRLRPRRRRRPHRRRRSIFGHVDVDHFTFDSTLLGATAHVFGSQNLSATDQTALRRRRRSRSPAATARTSSSSTVCCTPDDPALHTLTLDGQQGTDHYRVETTHRRRRAPTSINILDTGAPDDGADVADGRGHRRRRHLPAPPAVTSIPRETADRPAFVALLHGTVEGLRGSPAVGTGVERINYDAALNGRLTVIGGARRRRLRRRRHERHHHARRRRRRRRLPDRPDLRHATRRERRTRRRATCSRASSRPPAAT